jgi:hypothetical protein
MHVWSCIGLAFCTWAVSLAGIASLQQQCYANQVDVSSDLSGINGFSAGMPCKTVYRFYWFVVALEFVVIIKALAAVASGHLAKSRVAVVGLLSIVTVLYMIMTDSFLTLRNNPVTDIISDDPLQPMFTRTKVMLAGSLMTATANCFLIIAAGVEMEFKEVVERTVEREVAEKTVV